MPLVFIRCPSETKQISMNPWEPDYWFLAKDEKVEVTLRETGKKSTIPQNQLLGERLDEWGRQNYAASPGGTVWGMFAAEKELTSAYTSNNQVTPLIDGKDFMSDLHYEIRQARRRRLRIDCRMGILAVSLSCHACVQGDDWTTDDAGRPHVAADCSQRTRQPWS